MRAWIVTGLVNEFVMEVKGDVDKKDDECFMVSKVVSATKSPWLHEGPFYKPSWYLIREDAVAYAKQLRDSKVKNAERMLRKNPESKLRLQWEALIEQLNALTFEE